MSGYWQNCPYPPVDPEHPTENRCQWQRWVNTDEPLFERTIRNQLATHMRVEHMRDFIHLRSVDSDTPNTLSLTTDQMEILMNGIQHQIGEATVYELLQDDEPLIPLLVDLRRLAKEGGTINVVPF